MGMVSEFKEFVMKGNMMDMATGIIIGAAVSAVVGSLVDDIIMPIIGLFTGGVDFSGLSMVLGEGEAAPVFGYGAFIQALINFLIIAFVIFMIIKAVNSMKKKEEAAPAAPPEDVVLLREIRDSLKK
ncbi:MAG: large-conductance mechanosensitive channel protein MscL [Gammaproteobacteria bacterium]